MMRKAVAILAVAVTACAGVPDVSRSAAEIEIPRAHLVDLPPIGDPVVEDRPIWEGFADTHGVADGLVGLARGPVQVYESPGDSDPAMTLDSKTIIGTSTVLRVVTPPADGWVEVMLPVRPNGSTGWVAEAALEMYVADSEIIVDLDERRLTYKVGDVEVLSTEVGVGSKYNRTPTGVFFVTDNVTLANPNSPWGPHALGLSARSESITEFNGGDGIIGIHGTNNPSSIGGNISLGCVRLPNDMITALHKMVPLGTMVTIKA